MDISATIDELVKKRTELQDQIEKNKEEIKALGVKIRKLDTVMKHANEVLNENGASEPKNDNQGAEMRG